MNRAEIRHALYRAKNGIFHDSKNHIYDLVKDKIPQNESWYTFSKNWDIFYKDGVITVIRPEVDYDFIHSTCLEKSIHERSHIDMPTTPRQANAIQVVELSMLDGLMTWENYNKTWGVSVDHELKRINTRYFSTIVNRVTEEMIKDSAPSDGAAMNELPELPTIVLDEPRAMSHEEINNFQLVTNKKRQKLK